MTYTGRLQVIARRVCGRTILLPLHENRVHGGDITFLADICPPSSYWQDFENAAGRMARSCADAAMKAEMLDNRIRAMHAPSFSTAKLAKVLGDALATHGMVHAVRLSDEALSQLQDLHGS